MQAYLTLTRRELAGYFMSMTGYVIIAAATLLIGVSFKAVLEPIQNVPTLMPVTELFFNTLFFWLVLLFPPATPFFHFVRNRSDAVRGGIHNPPPVNPDVVLPDRRLALALQRLLDDVLFHVSE